MAKRLGIVTRHIVYANLPETVKVVLKRRRQFQQHTEEARELCTTKSDQQEAVEGECRCIRRRIANRIAQPGRGRRNGVKV